MNNEKIEYNKKMVGQKVKVVDEHGLSWIGEVKETIEDHSFLIRDDLNRDNIVLCQNFGADYLAGWSLVKSSNIEGYKKNLSLIKKKLKNV